MDLARGDFAAGRLVQPRPDRQTLSLPINLVYPSRRLVPRRATALMDAITLELKD